MKHNDKLFLERGGVYVWKWEDKEEVCDHGYEIAKGVGNIQYPRTVGGSITNI